MVTKKSEVKKVQREVKNNTKPVVKQNSSGLVKQNSAAKKPREVQIVKIFAIQQHYKQSDFKEQAEASDNGDEDEEEQK